LPLKILFFEKNKIFVLVAVLANFE
jgi:hypothetical protein